MQRQLPELVVLPIVFGKGRGEAQKFSSLQEHGQNIPGGSKGEVAERGTGAGKSSFLERYQETCLWLGQEAVGGHRKPCRKEPGDCSQAGPFSFGRLAVSLFSQM